MAVFINLPLFFKPGYELGEGEEVTGEQIRNLGQDLAARLEHIGNLVDKLTGAGWEAQTGLYDVMLSHPFFRTADEARAQLDGLGIDPEHVNLDEFEDEDDELLEDEFDEEDEREDEGEGNEPLST
jgi:hypothetical protein